MTPTDGEVASGGWREVAAALDVEAGRPDDPGNSGEGHGRAGPSGPRRGDGGALPSRVQPMTADDSTPGRGQDGDGESDERVRRVEPPYTNEVVGGLQGALTGDHYDSGASVRAVPLVPPNQHPHAAVSLELAGSWGVAEVSMSLQEAEALADQLVDAARRGSTTSHPRD